MIQYFDSGYVRQLRDDAGFDAWWLDGDEQAARQGYMDGEATPLPEKLRQAVNAYQKQVDAIQAKWPELKSFYGDDHIIHTVTSGPTYLSCAEIVSRMLPDDAEV